MGNVQKVIGTLRNQIQAQDFAVRIVSYRAGFQAHIKEQGSGSKL
jgi:hypothetical protein